MTTWAAEETEFENNVKCVVCPSCAFTFDANHLDQAGQTYSCPVCAEIKLNSVLAAAKVLDDLIPTTQAFHFDAEFHAAAYKLHETLEVELKR